MSAGYPSVRECRLSGCQTCACPSKAICSRTRRTKGKQRLPSQTASARPSTSRASSMRPERWSTARVAVRRVSNATKGAYRGFLERALARDPARQALSPRRMHGSVVGSRAGDGEVASLRREATPARLGGGKTVHYPIPRPLKPPMAEDRRSNTTQRGYRPSSSGSTSPLGPVMRSGRATCAIHQPTASLGEQR